MSETTPAPQFETHHSGEFHGNNVRYRCLAGETTLNDADGKPRVGLFSFSYLAETHAPAQRPVTFVFNGGPGSASLWLHMGAIGPRIVKVPSDAQPAGAGPYKVEDNTQCNLDLTDLVFIDPPGTGFSRMFGEAKLADAWGLEADAEIVADFIKAWLSQHRRWASPRYLCGESYGTTRAVAVAGKLSSMLAGVALNGIALISTILDFHTTRFEKGNPLADACFLPTFAATALFHGRAKTTLSQAEFLDAVREFATREYLPALFEGSRIDPARYASVRDRLAAFTGLSADWLDRTRLRIDRLRFRKELMREAGLTVGRLDSRYTGQDYDGGGEAPDSDVSSTAIESAFVSTCNDHLTTALEVDLPRPYVPFNAEALKTWDWRPKAQAAAVSVQTYVNVAPTLARLLRENPALRVLVASGLYDLATPFFGAETSLAGNGIPTGRIRMTYYQAGHMMYLHDPSLAALTADLREMLQSSMALPPGVRNDHQTCKECCAMTIRIPRRAALLGGLAAPFIARNGFAQSETIRLGSLTPQTGAGGPYGPGMVKTIRAVVDDVNAAGGVLGRKIELISEDDETNPDAGVRAARKLIDVNHVVAVIGTWASAVTTAVAPLCWENKVMLFTTSGADSITRLPHQGFIIRTQPDSTLQADRSADFMLKQGSKKVGFLSAQSPFAVSTYERQAIVLKAGGGEAVGNVIYDASKTSFRTEIDQILKQQPDALFLNSYQPDLVVLLRELFRAGYDGRRLTPAYAANDKLLAALPPETTEGLVAYAPSPDIGSAAFKTVQGVVGANPDPYSCQTFDHTNLAILAMAKAGAATGQAVHDAVRSVGNPAGVPVSGAVEGMKLIAAGKEVNYSGASGECKFTPIGDITGCKFRFDVIEKGKPRLLQLS